MIGERFLKRLILKSGIFEHKRLNGILDPKGYTFKRLLLKKLFRLNDCETFVETGTNLGETTRYMAKLASIALTCEPFAELYNFNLRQNRAIPNIKMWNTGSETCFQEMLEAVEGPPLFFLDGHFSGIGTSLTECCTPVLRELDLIGVYKLAGSVVVIDDVRLFKSKQNLLAGSFEDGYPDLDLAVEKLISAVPGNEIRIVGDCLVSARRFE